MSERTSQYLFNGGYGAGWLGVLLYFTSGDTVGGWTIYALGAITCLYVIARGFLHDYFGVG